MDFDGLLPLIGFLIAAQATPGPNNVMLAAAGAQRRLQPALAMLAAIMVTVAAVQFAVALGLGALLQAVPAVQTGVKAVGSVLLLYIAWRIWSADPTAKGALVSPAAAAAFQLFNPKLLAFTTSSSAFLPAVAPFYEAAWLSLLVLGLGIASGGLWVALGALLGAALWEPRRRRRFNQVSALAIAALIPFLWV